LRPPGGEQGQRRTDRGNPSGRRRLAVSMAHRVVQSVSKAGMDAAPIEIDRDLVDLLEELHRPAKQAARELIVLELYRQGEVSSGRAAQLLGKEREEFVKYASAKGIPYFQLDSGELQRELDTFKNL